MKTPLWTPTPKRVAQSNLTAFQQWLAQEKGLSLEGYEALYQWSITERASFWESIWNWTGVVSSQPYESVLQNGDDIMGSQWFEGARLNYAENLLRYCKTQPTLEAIRFRNEIGTDRVWTYGDLWNEVEKTASALRKLGVTQGDRVAGFLPNLPETIVAMLAATSLGAIWSSTSPDFGLQGVLDRFGQIEPKVLFACDGYYYKGKVNDSRERLKGIIEAIPSLEKVVVVPYVSEQPELSELPKAVSLPDFQDAEPTPLEFAQLPFNHPLFIMYSSGTTGVPKCIVHGAGGTLLQHLKEHRLHVDLKEGDGFFYFTTCGWMMWNWLVTGLASGTTLMLFDGSPFFPDPGVLFRYAEECQWKVFGTSAKFLAALEKTGAKPREEYDLSALGAMLSTGSPLSEASFEYVYRDIKQDIHLASISGGTDLISCFVLGAPTLPVYTEEIQCRGLGMAVDSFDDEGKPLRNEKGELVCARSFPSQPIYFWNDEDNARYRSAYFEFFDNIWRHGDFVEINDRGGIIIYGRSDATLNPGGVRIGTAEIYRSVEPMDELLDSLVVGHKVDDDVQVVLFVKLKEGVELNEALTKQIRTTIRQQTTPRHVPAKVFAVADIPYTISGKKVELAVRRVLMGMSVPNRDALANPESLEHFKGLL